jgi:hypothetical protein
MMDVFSELRSIPIQRNHNFKVSLKVNKGPTRCNSMQTFIHCHVTLHVSGVTHLSSGVLKTVSATSGVCHGNGTVTSFHRGLIPQGLLCTKDWFNNRKNFALKFQRSAYWCVNKMRQRLWLCVSSPLGRFFEVLVVH